MFSEISGEPTPEIVDAARKICVDASAQFVIGLGGGSALDTAKAVAALARAERSCRDYFSGVPVPGDGLPCIAIPSTFGTGSEATVFAVLKDSHSATKRSISHPSMMPAVALVDADLGTGTPKRQAAASGLDGLTQAVESWMSRSATDETRARSEKAFGFLAAGLDSLRRGRWEEEGKKPCAKGALLAGIAFQNAGLGLVHGLAHPLGGLREEGHGELCAILLPHVLRYNRRKARPIFDRAERIVGGDLVQWSQTLVRDLDFAPDLRHLELTAVEQREVARRALAAGPTKANPREVSNADLLSFLDDLCG